MRMSRQRGLVVALVIVMQVVTVATVLLVQRSMAERAMLERANFALSQSAHTTADELGRDLGRARRQLDALAGQIEQRIFPMFVTNRARASSELFFEMITTLQANRDVKSVGFVAPDGRHMVVWRGKRGGIELQFGSNAVVRRGRLAVGERGDAVLASARVVDLPNPRDSRVYREAMRSGHRAWTVQRTPEGTIVTPSAVLRALGSPRAVAWATLRPNVFTSALRRGNPLDGSSAELVDLGRGRAWSQDGALSVTRAAHLMSAARPGGAWSDPDLIGAAHAVMVDDLSWSVVLHSSRATAVAGAGTTVGSVWIAVLVGLAAGLVILPVIVRATRGMESLHERATADGLTGLPNREEFTRVAARMLARAQRRGDAFTIAVLDLDGFKAVNDGYGHGHGDESLRIFARRVRAAARGGDVLARFGGDEFVAALPGVAGDDAVRLLERMRAAAADHPIHVAEATHHLDCTIGFSDTSAAPMDVATMMEQADAALIVGKGRAKGRVYDADAILGVEETVV